MEHSRHSEMHDFPQSAMPPNNIIRHSLRSSRKSVHERHQNSDGWQVKWSVFRDIWLKRQDAQLSNDVYEGGGLHLVEISQNEDFLKKTG